MFRSLLADPRGLAAPTFEEAVDALRRYLHDARELTQNHGVSCSIALGLLRHVPLSTAIETVGRCPHLKDRSLADRVENFPEPINIMALVAVLEDPCIQKLGVSHSFAIQFARRKDYSERLVLFHRIVELYPDWRVSFCAKIALANEPHEGLQLAGELVSVYRASVTSACEFVTSTGSRAAIAGLKEAYERIHPHGYSMTNALSLWRKREGLARADALGLATQLLPAGTKRTSLQIVRAAAHPATLLETLRVLEKEGQPLSLSVLRAIAKHPEVTPHSSAVVTLLADGLTAQEALAIATSANPSAARALILEAREAKLSDPRGRARLAFYPRPVERHALVRALSRYYSPKMPKPAEVAKILESADPQKMTSIIALAAERRISLSCFELQRLGRRPQPERCFAAFDKFPNLGLTPSQIADLILLRDIEGGLANVVRLREKFPPIGLSHAVRMACSRDPGKAEAALAELLRTDSRSMNISTLVLIACKGEQVVFDGPRAPLAPHTTKASVPLLALSNPADRMALAAAAQQFKHLHLSSTLANYLMRSSRYQHDFEQLRQLDACTGKQRIMEREIRFLLRHSVQGLADELWRLGFDAPPPASGLSEAQIRQIRFMKLCSKLPRGIAFVTNALPTDSREVATAALAENRASSLAALSAIRSLAPLGISELQERRPTEADQIRVLLARSRISLWPDVRKEAVSVTAQLLLPYAKRILRTRYDDQCWEAFASVCETYDAYQHPLKGLAPAPIESHLRARFRFIKFDAWFASLPEEVRKERHRVDFLRRKLKRSLNRSPNVDELRAACLERGMDRTSIAYLVEGKSDVLLSTPIADGLSFQDIIEESDGDLGDQKGGISRGHVRRRVRR